MFKLLLKSLLVLAMPMAQATPAVSVLKAEKPISAMNRAELFAHRSKILEARVGILNKRSDLVKRLQAALPSDRVMVSLATVQFVAGLSAVGSMVHGLRTGTDFTRNTKIVFWSSAVIAVLGIPAVRGVMATMIELEYSDVLAIDQSLSNTISLLAAEEREVNEALRKLE